YSPGDRLSARKIPSLLVVNLRSKPVAAFFTATVAFDKTAPFGSVTVPLMLPLVVWARVRFDRKRVSRERANSFSNRTRIFNLRTLSWRTDGKGACGLLMGKPWRWGVVGTISPRCASDV